MCLYQEQKSGCRYSDVELMTEKCLWMKSAAGGTTNKRPPWVVYQYKRHILHFLIDPVLCIRWNKNTLGTIPITCLFTYLLWRSVPGVGRPRSQRLSVTRSRTDHRAVDEFVELSDSVETELTSVTPTPHGIALLLLLFSALVSKGPRAKNVV